MRTPLVVLLFAVAGLRLPVAAAGEDTVRVFPQEEILVTATRAEALRSSVASPVSIIPRRGIQASTGSTVASLLSGLPGLFLRSYGGGGALQAVSVRGMAAEHTLVLLDGLRLTGYQNGQSDLGLLFSSNVERVEIVRGGHSSLYGADALGGVINIITRRSGEGLHGRLASTLGSFGLQAVEGSAAGTSGGIGWTAFARQERAAGDYPFTIGDGQTMRRSGADYRLSSTEASVSLPVTERIKADARVSRQDASRGSPGSVEWPFAARLEDREIRLQGGILWQASPGAILSFRFSSTASHQTFGPGTGDYMNRVLTLTPEIRFVIAPEHTGSAGAEVVRARIRGTVQQPEARIQTSLFLATQHTLSAGPFTDLVLYPSLRFDRFSDVGEDMSPRIGVNLGLLDAPRLRLRASAGKSFRVPTFNDLFWPASPWDRGNPGLRPERSIGVDAGLSAAAGGLRAELGFFSLRTKDRIVWMADEAWVWSPVNVTDVLTQGIEAEAGWLGFGGMLEATVSSTWMASTKKSADFPGDPTQGKNLVSVPSHMASAVLLLVFRPVTLHLRQEWTGRREITESNDRSLPGFAVASAGVTLMRAFPPVTSSLKLEVLNLFNRSYEVMAFYPMPGREVRGTLGVEF